MNEYKFPEIDTSYWKLDDKVWKEERKQEWLRIEPMLASTKSSRGKTIIKQYFLTGKMPDWEKLAQWDNGQRHVDIFILLWLHPSWDESVLMSLRDEYMEFDLLAEGDIDVGFNDFLSWGTIMASQDYSDDPEEDHKYELVTDGHNELLFRVLMGDMKKKEYTLDFSKVYYPPFSRTFVLPQSDIEHINQMGKWLCINVMRPINEDMLFQYDQPLEWWYASCTRDEDYFNKEAQQDVVRAFFKKALYRFHHFDTEKEGDTCRARFVHKIRKTLDEREFISEFKQMWLDVKAGKIEVADPWGR